MTKLNLLGAQRVKALTEILERKFSDKIREVEKDRIGPEEATRLLADKKGLTKELNEIQSHVDALNSKARFVKEELGVTIDASMTYRSYRAPEETRKELDEVSDNGINEKIAKLKRELEERKSRLWLVETLEEAQEIVNREINID